MCIRDSVEAALRGAFDHVEIDTHLEPLEDPRSYEERPVTITGIAAEGQAEVPPEVLGTT